MEKVEICRTCEDTATIAALAEEIWTEYFTPIIGEAQVRYMLDKFQSASAIQKAVFDDGYRYSILYLHDQPSGYCGVHAEQEKRQLFLSKLYLKKEVRGKGLSHLLLDRAISYAKELDLDSIYLTVNKHNANTIAVYKSYGFRQEDAVVTDIGGGFVMDDYVYRLSF